MHRFALLGVALLPLMVVWSLANPMFASPDEASHLLRAQGFSQLTFSSPYPSDGLPLGAAECFARQPNATADCMDLTWGDGGLQFRVDPIDGYPPLLHAVAAPATLVGSGLANTYVVRIWMAVVATALFAWAGTMLTRPGSGPWPATGLLVAITPMVVFTSATVNPSGISAGFAAVGIAAVVAARLHHESLVRLLPALLVGIGGLIATRRDGLLWLAVLAVVVAIISLPGRQGWQTLRRRVPTIGLVAGAVVATGMVVVVAMIGVSRFTRWRSGGGSEVWESVQLIQRFVLDIVGNFGWLDAQIPTETLVLALVAIGFVVLLGISAGPGRWAIGTTVLLVTLFAAMVALESQRSLYVQGRYLFPLWVPLLVLAGAGAAQGGLPGRMTRRATAIVLGLWAFVHLVGFTHNLRRYAVGQDGPWSFFTSASAWQPPMMSNAVAMAAFAAALVVAVVAVARLLRPLYPPPTPTPVAGTLDNTT